MANILVCDDEPNIVKVIGDILKDEGHTVFESMSGSEGLNICKEKAIDVAILDIWMPVLSGIDVLLKIKELKPEIEIIMISGHGNIDMAVKCMKSGAFDFIEKPLSLKKIISTVNRALEKRKKLKK